MLGWCDFRILHRFWQTHLPPHCGVPLQDKGRAMACLEERLGGNGMQGNHSESQDKDTLRSERQIPRAGPGVLINDTCAVAAASGLCALPPGKRQLHPMRTQMRQKLELTPLHRPGDADARSSCVATSFCETTVIGCLWVASGELAAVDDAARMQAESPDPVRPQAPPCRLIRKLRRRAFRPIPTLLALSASGPSAHTPTQ